MLRRVSVSFSSISWTSNSLRNRWQSTPRPVPDHPTRGLLYSSKWLVKCFVCIFNVSAVSPSIFPMFSQLTYAIDVNARPPGPSLPPNQGLLYGDDKCLMCASGQLQFQQMIRDRLTHSSNMSEAPPGPLPTSQPGAYYIRVNGL